MDAAQLAGLTHERLAAVRVLTQAGVTRAFVVASCASQLPEVLRAGATKLNDQVSQELDAITQEFRLGEAPPF